MTAPVTPGEPVLEVPGEAGRGRFALPEDPNRRALTLGAVVLSVLLLLFLASRILLGGGEEEVPDETAAPATSTTSTTAELSLDGGAGRPDESFEVFSTKNPFTPLINPPGSGGGSAGGGAGGGSGGGVSGGTTQTTLGGGGSGGGTSGGGTSGGGTSGGTTPTTIRGGSGSGSGSGSGGTTTTQAGGSSGGQANEPRRQERVALLDVLRRQGRVVAQVRVNDTVYTVGEGDVFAENYRVLSIDEASECGRFIFGDEQFRLCRGEETLK
ncbi:MAG TPA: hypothetical protein VMY88_02770 [Acidimicrobiales bacterium]|nr:hypothetical protein [Acidimicrobiales bacterium]